MLAAGVVTVTGCTVRRKGLVLMGEMFHVVKTQLKPKPHSVTFDKVEIWAKNGKGKPK